MAVFGNGPLCLAQGLASWLTTPCGCQASGCQHHPSWLLLHDVPRVLCLPVPASAPFPQDAMDAHLTPEDLVHLTRRTMFLVVDADNAYSFSRLQVGVRQLQQQREWLQATEQQHNLCGGFASGTGFAGYSRLLGFKVAGVLGGMLPVVKQPRPSFGLGSSTLLPLMPTMPLPHMRTPASQTRARSWRAPHSA